MLKNIIAILILIIPFSLFAKVWVYPFPGNPIKTSPFYKVQIQQEGNNFNSFIYYSPATFNDLERSSSWTTFSFEDKITVIVEVLNTNIENCIIRPKSKNIQFQTEGNKIIFELDQPRKLAVEINGDKKNPLFIFADRPEEIVPAKAERGVLYFEPGVHNIGLVEVPDSVKHIYISGGAYLRGAFKNSNRASNFKITGRGIISSEVFEKILNDQRKDFPDWRERNPHNVYLQGEGQNVYVEGITFTDGPMYRLVIRQTYSTVRNCKFFGWYYNTDGVSVGTDGLIEDCFFRCNDDAIKVYRDNLIANNCVFWQNDNGASFQISWNSKENNHNFRVYDCDVIHCEHSEDANNRAIFNSVHGGGGNLSGYLFQDIRIEGDVYRLFKLTIRTSPSDGDPEFGSISKLHFKNILLEGKCLMSNEIWGYNHKHKISDVIFENLEINSEKIMNEKSGNFSINYNTTSNISFK